MKVNISIDDVTLTLTPSEYIAVYSAIKRHSSLSVVAKKIHQKLPRHFEQALNSLAETSDIKDLKKLNERFLGGGALTDDELDTLLSFYRDLEEKLSLFGAPYLLVWRDVFDKKKCLEEFKIARKLWLK
jgi:hypothetical protein